MLLTIRNKTLNNVVINSELGSVRSRRTLVLDLTIDEIERARTDLARLAAAGVIVWSTTKTTSAADDEAEGATVAYADRPQPINLGNTIVVDPVYGPVRTIEDALSLAVANDVIWVMPGTYAPTAGITLPANVSLRGLSTERCVIQMANVVADTDLLTMGNGNRVEDLTFRLTSSGHHALRGVVWPGTSTVDSFMRVCVVEVNNSGASDGGSSNVYGIHSTGIGIAADETTNIRACTVKVTSSGLGDKRGILVNSASKMTSRDITSVVEKTGAASGSTYISAETNHANAHLSIRFALLKGPADGQDCQRTLGTLQLGQIDLVNSRVGGRSISPVLLPALFLFSDPGTLPNNSVRFLRPGTAAVDTVEVSVDLPTRCVVQHLSIRARIAPGTGTTTVTVRKNGVDTALVAQLSGAVQEAIDAVDAVGFDPNDDLSIKVETTGGAGNQTQDIVVSVQAF